MIGIIGAMDEEVAMLKEKLTEVQVETKAAMDFYKGKLEGKDVVVVRSGIGKVNAAMCARSWQMYTMQIMCSTQASQVP